MEVRNKHTYSYINITIAPTIIFIHENTNINQVENFPIFYYFYVLDDVFFFPIIFFNKLNS